MIVHPSFPPRTFAEFAAYAKKSPTQLTYGSGGIGSTPHMTGELLNSLLSIRMNHVPYKGEGPAIADTLGGQIPIMFGNLPVAVPHVKSGKLRALANTSASRSPRPILKFLRASAASGTMPTKMNTTTRFPRTSKVVVAVIPTPRCIGWPRC